MSEVHPGVVVLEHPRLELVVSLNPVGHLAGVSHIQVGHPHPTLNVSISTAVCVWSAVDEGWTVGSTVDPEVARQTTGVEFGYLSA